MDSIKTVVSMVQAEFNIYWIEQNALLFREQYQSFFREYASNYDITCIPTKGAMKLVATLKITEGQNDESKH